MNQEETVQAINSYRAQKPDFLPPGNVKEIVVGGEHLTLKMEIKYADTVHPLDINLEYNKMVEVLVMFCISQRIRLPRVSIKTAYADDDEVVLEIRIENDAAPAEISWPRLNPVTRGAAPGRKRL